MKKFILLLLTLVSINLSAQNAKNKGWYIEEKHYPEIKLPVEYQNYAVKVNSNSDNVRLIINGEQKSSSFKNTNISILIDRSLKIPGFTKSENPDFIIELTDLGIKHILSVKEKKNYGKDAKNTYTGIVEISSSIKVVVTDTKKNILFDKVFTQKSKTESAEVFNNASIKSNGIALSQIKKQYNANAIEYRSSKNMNQADYVIGDISKSLKSKFSTYYEAKRINLFFIKKEEKFGIKNNDQVEKLIEMNKLKFSDTYKENLKSIAKESLTHFENELKKIKDKTDKKQKKVYWSILSNISGVNYALGNYDKAIEYAKMRENVDYNKKWKYNLEISQKRKEIIEENKK